MLRRYPGSQKQQKYQTGSLIRRISSTPQSERVVHSSPPREGPLLFAVVPRDFVLVGAIVTASTSCGGFYRSRPCHGDHQTLPDRPR